MARSLMVCVDGSEHAEKAFHKALEVKKEEDSLLVVHSCQFPDHLIGPPAFGGVPAAALDASFVVEEKRLIKERADRLCKRYVDECQERKIPHVTMVVLESIGSAKEALCSYAEEKKVDAVFVGTRGNGAIKRMLLGSFSDHLVHHLQCDVFVVKK